MKFLCFADLHYNGNNDNMIECLKGIVKKENPDIIIIAGDVVESSIVKHKNIYHVIRTQMFYFTDVPIVFCLGNHEFSYNSIDNVFKKLSYYDGSDFNCCCLDYNNFYNVENSDYRLIGNVLWYDNTMKFSSIQKDDIIEPGWLDSTILDFIPSYECKKNKNAILRNIKSDKKHILITHCVPHKKLNWFSEYEPFSPYNMYSGCADFLSELANVEWAICGHTHKRMTATINGINCVNIGNDYFHRRNDIESFVFEM